MTRLTGLTPVVGSMSSDAALPRRQGRREDGQDGQPSARSAASAVPVRHLFLGDGGGSPHRRFAVYIGTIAALLDSADAIARSGSLDPHPVDILCDKLVEQIDKIRRDAVLQWTGLPITHRGRLVDLMA